MFNILKRPSNNDKFSRLVDAYREPIYRFIRGRVESHDDAADISQEVFIRAYQNLDKLRDESAARAWLYRIAHNEIIRFVQDRERATTELIADTVQSSLADSAHVDYDRAVQELFETALSQLSERRRAVFELRYYQELSFKEIAEILDSNESTMKVTYHQAKSFITDYILEHNIE
ncbi:MAG: RNA polymerase sigma factor [Muribaculaceae bacterium]|nr:RNA polymerase sigma factor [Muribaculaceae bacterium]MDE6351532.1 RNA polymerase sigma factor [Muribaculaceae bacterium]MDE6644282.1 RNA polymerase sigma factor [Muribaculaceae bacterium]